MRRERVEPVQTTSEPETALAHTEAAARLQRLRTYRTRTAVTLVAIFIVVAALPLVLTTRYTMVLATLAVMWMGLASSYNLFTGFTGYISFGHAAFFGLGAYVVGIGTTRYSIPLPLAMLLAAVLVGALACVLGLLTLRIRGHYFAIATLGIAEATYVLINYYQSFTKGSFGFGLPLSVTSVSTTVQFYVMLGITTLVVVICATVLWSRYGARLLAIRADEVAAEAIGINTALCKILALCLSGALSALLGGAFAWVLGYLTPEAVFSAVISLQLVVMVIIGGLGTLIGPLIGGAGFFLLQDLVLQSVPNVHLIVLGALLIAGMLVLQSGIMGRLQLASFWPKGLRA